MSSNLGNDSARRYVIGDFGRIVDVSGHPRGNADEEGKDADHFHNVLPLSPRDSDKTFKTKFEKNFYKIYGCFLTYGNETEAQKAGRTAEKEKRCR